MLDLTFIFVKVWFMPIIVNNHWTILFLEKKNPRRTNVLKYTVCLEFCAITCYYGTTCIINTYTVYSRVFFSCQKICKNRENV